MAMRAVLALALVSGASACTTLAADLGGVTVATHTADCPNCDFRLAKVKRHTLAEGDDASYPVMLYRAHYPREVSDRALTWAPERIEAPTPEHAAFWASEAFLEGQFPAGPKIPMHLIDAASARAGGRVGGETSFAYYEALFGVANEAGVAIGESTCYAKMVQLPADAVSDAAQGYTGALFDVSALTRLALERCGTARCSCELMGLVAEEHGYYTAGMTLDEGGECLSVADGSEAWDFHVVPANVTTKAVYKTDGTTKTKTRASAVWAAMRLNPGEVSVCANTFVIRGVPEAPGGLGADGRDYLVGKEVRSAADRSGLKLHETPAGEVDFFATYGGGSDAFNLARQFAVYDRLAPSLHLKDDTAMMVALRLRAKADGVKVAKTPEKVGSLDEFPAGVWADIPGEWRDTVDGYYPVAIPIDQAVLPPPTDGASRNAAAAIFVDLMREVYEGTKWDAAIDPGAGPFGDPEESPGAPRRISLPRTAFWHVSMSSAPPKAKIASLASSSSSSSSASSSAPKAPKAPTADPADAVYPPVVRFGQYAPHSSPAVPLFIAGDAEPPACFTTGSMFAVDALANAAKPSTKDSASLWWAGALVGGWVRAFFRVSQPVVEVWQQTLERRLDADLLLAMAAAQQANDTPASSNMDDADDVLAAFNDRAAGEALKTWGELFAHLVLTKRDGYMVSDRCVSDEVPGALRPVEGDRERAQCEAVPPNNPTAAFDVSVRGMPYLPWWVNEFGQYPDDAVPDASLKGSLHSSLAVATSSGSAGLWPVAFAFLCGGAAALGAVSYLSAKGRPTHSAGSLRGSLGGGYSAVGSSAVGAVEMASAAPKTYQTYQTVV